MDPEEPAVAAAEPTPVPAPLPSALVTKAIIAANVAVFAVMVAKGVAPLGAAAQVLVQWAATFGPTVALDGEWWRLVTAAFIHVGAIHLALNMYVLWGAGPLTERIYGHAAFLLLYVLAAIG